MKEKSMEQNRIKSPVLWAALIAQILSILVLLDVVSPTQSETINQVVAAVLQMLVAFGVLNSPTSADRF
jgi:uncharacterized membrane protein